MNEYAKTCACGRGYDLAEWLKLPSAGDMPDGEGELLELRNCVCGSTIAMLVAYEDQGFRFYDWEPR